MKNLLKFENEIKWKQNKILFRISSHPFPLFTIKFTIFYIPINIENREFDGKKWEGMGWDSKKNFILCSLN